MEPSKRLTRNSVEKKPETLLAILSEETLKVLKMLAEESKINIDEVKTVLKKRVQKRISDEIVCEEWKTRIIENRVKELVRGELSLGNAVVAIEAVLEDAGLVGTSSGVLNAVLEVGVSWDHLIDLPFIPGSSLKGAFRNTLLALCTTNLRKHNDGETCLRHLADLLGWLEGAYDISQVANLLGLEEEKVKEIAEEAEHAGLLIFHDTYLLCNEAGRLLEPWVITPHYRDAETEYDARPVPVEHVVLAPGLRGVFVVGVRKEAKSHLNKLSELLLGRGCSGRGCLVFLSQLVGAALASGVGARTSRGYSRFRVERVYVRW